MTLTKYQTSPTLETRFNSDLGRSIKDINFKQPIQNPAYEAVLQEGGRPQLNRINALIQARGGLNAPSRSRALLPFGLSFGAMYWSDGAFAMPSRINPIEALPVINMIDWSHPDIAIGIGSTILATQIAALVQRHAMLKHLLPVKSKETQLDLFPEILAVDDPKASPWEVDAATRQGKVRSENQDAAATLDFADGSKAMIVCDGAGGIEGGREASQSAVAAIVQSLEQQFEENDGLKSQDLEHAIDAARQASASGALTGVTTALLILLQDDQVHWATLGDGDVAVIWPDGMVGHLQVPHHEAGAPSNIINAFIGKGCTVPPRTGRQRVETGAIVVAMSDGASDLFPYEDVALMRKEITSVEGLADSFLKDIENARDPETQAYLHNDNMTLAMARLNAGGDYAK